MKRYFINVNGIAIDKNGDPLRFGETVYLATDCEKELAKAYYQGGRDEHAQGEWTQTGSVYARKVMEDGR